jgi:hypothetical protein
MSIRQWLFVILSSIIIALSTINLAVADGGPIPLCDPHDGKCIKCFVGRVCQ